MDKLRQEDLLGFVSDAPGPCVSIYMPTRAGGIERRGDCLRLKNLLREADEELTRRNMAAGHRRELLEPATALLTDEDFWASTSNGLVLLLSPHAARCYRLPPTFEPSLSVADRFRLRPLLPTLAGNAFGYVLALSHDRAQLYRLTTEAATAVDVPRMPTSIDEALNIDSADRGAQVHSSSASVSRKQAAVFHGQGGRPDTAKADLTSYCRAVDRAVCDHLGSTAAPLLLAAVEYLAPLYARISSYPHLSAAVVHGNPDRLSASELHTRAGTILEQECNRPLEEELARSTDQLSSGRASCDPHRILPAAATGQVQTLFFDPEGQLFGTYDCERQLVDVNAPAATAEKDLVELAALETIRHGGKIYPVAKDRLPPGSPLTAMFRYATPEAMKLDDGGLP